MAPKDWTPRKRIEQMFRGELLRLVEKYLQFPDSATLGEITMRLADFERISVMLQDYAARAASGMVTAVQVSNAKSWREAASIAGRGNEIFRELQRLPLRVEERRVELIRENAQLIGTLPSRLREDTARWIAAMQTQGERPQAIAKSLRKQLPHVARTRITLIARTETSKAATAMTQARSEDLGLDWYIWLTSRDSRVRKSHKTMSNVLVRWSDPPSPELLSKEPSEGRYHAGNIYNCRCDPAPLVDLRQVKWPAKVYYGNRIQRMTIAQFRRIAA